MDFAALKLHIYIYIYIINLPHLIPGAARGCSLPMDALAQPWTDTRLCCLTAHLGGNQEERDEKETREVLSALKINGKNAEKLKFTPKSPLDAQEGASLPLELCMGGCSHPGLVLGSFQPHTLQESSSGSSQSQLHFQGFACFILAHCICGKLRVS